MFSVIPPPAEVAAPSPRRRRVGIRVSAALLAAVLLLSGCRDSPTDPFQGLVAGETGLAALALELPLPSPVADDGGELPRAVELWRSSWERPVLEGRLLRAPLYPELGRFLARTRDAEALEDALGVAGAGVRRAAELDAGLRPPFLDAGIRTAEEAYERAEEARAASRPGRAWSELLRSADALREVGPEAVARSAVDRAEEGFRRILPDDPYSEKERERIRHLVRGSRQALEDGAWPLAIRRAYYALGLLDGNG